MVKINALLGTLKTFDIREPENKHFRLSNAKNLSTATITS